MDDMKELSLEERKALSRFYNEVNKKIYGCGVAQLKVEQLDNVIVFLTRQQRVSAMKSLENRYFELKQLVDAAICSEFKLRFKESLEEQTQFKVSAILRDYDSETELACTLVVIG